MEGSLQRTVGANVRAVRERLGDSQESFGERVGWHRTLVGSVERGERNLTLRSIERLSDTLGIHPLDLLWDRSAVGISFSADGTARFEARDGLETLTAADSGSESAPRGEVKRRRRRPRPSST